MAQLKSNTQTKIDNLNNSNTQSHITAETNPHSVTAHQTHTSTANSKSVLVGQGTSILIPMYLYPANVFTNPDYLNIIKLAKENPSISIHVILNPTNGAGNVTDGNYDRAIARLRGAGAYVYGYVATGYGTPTAPVNAEIDKWVTYYGVLDGIFFDELSNVDTQAMRDQYKAYNDYAHKLGFFTTIGNPGATVPYLYFKQDVMDIIVTYENSTYPAESLYLGDWADSYMELNKNRRAALVYNQAVLDNAGLALLCKYNGMVYITSGTLPSPWGTIPTYMAELVSKLTPTTSTGPATSATGGGSDSVFYENDQIITATYTITPGKNAMSAGDITIAQGVTVTIPTGSTWVIV